MRTLDGARLVLAPGAGDALLEAGRVPRQVEVDHHVGRLEVEPHAAGVGGEEEPAVGVLLEAPDLLRGAAGCGTEPVCQAKPTPIS